MTHLQDVIICTGTITDKYEVDGEGRIVGQVQAADQTGQVKLTGALSLRCPSVGKRLYWLFGTSGAPCNGVQYNQISAGIGERPLRSRVRRLLRLSIPQSGGM